MENIEDREDWFDYDQVSYDEDFKPITIVDAAGKTPEDLLVSLRLLVASLENYVANPNG